MARGSLLNLADRALSKVVLGSVDRMMQPQAQPNQEATYPQQQAGGMPQQLPKQRAAQAMAMPQQLPGAAGATNEGP